MVLDSSFDSSVSVSLTVTDSIMIVHYDDSSGDVHRGESMPDHVNCVVGIVVVGDH
jgi:hypothetical protein